MLDARFMRLLSGLKSGVLSACPLSQSESQPTAGDEKSPKQGSYVLPPGPGPTVFCFCWRK